MTCVSRVALALAGLCARGLLAQALTPLGAEIEVNAYTTGDQGFPAIATDGVGCFFIAWTGVDESGAGIFGQSYIFGDPTDNRPYAWVFTGHHLTVRCDGNSEADRAFGGPMYYGHSPNGYSNRNCFYYQTQSARRVFDALNGQQRQQALVTGSPGEQMQSVTFRPAGQARPGLAASQLTADQRQLVEEVMRVLISPYRQEDGDEVMEILRRNGGLEQLHLAFYRQNNGGPETQWHFWRLEGPGFVWNYRVLPHVHCYVNIAAQT